MADEPADRLVGEVVDERWKLVEKLGEGGMGVVYRAERVKLGKAVAIKFLEEAAVSSKPAVARFDREARAISRLQHRHCVGILDFGVWRKRPYIVMEYVAGRSLNKEMGKPTMTPPRAVRIMRQILEALRHAHAMGVVHRDLKPENVMLTESTGDSDYVKLLDFGLARIISIDEPTISHPKMVAGTPSYMSPEQARGEKVDHRTDIYSAGVILYGMVVGKKPFSANDQIDVLRMHMNVRPPPPRKTAPDKRISLELEKVILRALEKEREARFYHAEEFLAALDAVPEARAESPARRRRGRMLAAAALLVATAGGGAAAWRWHAVRARARATMAAWARSEVGGRGEPGATPAAGGAGAPGNGATAGATTGGTPGGATAPGGAPGGSVPANGATTGGTAAGGAPATGGATAGEAPNGATPGAASGPGGATTAPGGATTAPGGSASPSGTATGNGAAPGGAAATPGDHASGATTPGGTLAGGPSGPGGGAAPGGANPSAASAEPAQAPAGHAAAQAAHEPEPNAKPAPELTKSPEPAAPAKPSEPPKAAGEPAKAAPVSAVTDPGAASQRVAALLDADRLADAERLLLAEQILEPHAGWVHLQLGELYFRRLWRKDAEREWEMALKLDPTLKSDARLGQRLCSALGPAWNGAGQRLIVRYVGADAVAPLHECIRGANDLARVQTAAGLIVRVGGRGKLDKDLVAARTAELTKKK